MLLPLTLQRDKPLQRQLYAQLRALIESGVLQKGSRMPSTRDFAVQYGVSRMTAVATYDRLCVEGLLHTVPAGGTFVGVAAASGIGVAVQPVAQPPQTAVPSLSSEVMRADPALFPSARWRALLRASLGGREASQRGLLQATLAKWLCGTRGLAVMPEQVIVVGARQRALDIVAHLLLKPGGRVAFEAPGDEVAARLWAARGARLVGVPVDQNGMVTDALPGAPVALLHLTPGCQYPTGAVLSDQRRAEVLAWAAAQDAYIVEVDRVGDMRYDHDHSPALMARDSGGRVLHVGDFTSVLGPVVSIAYLVVPPQMAAAAEAARRMLDGAADGIEFGALAEFLESNAYSRHLIALRRIYAARRAALVAALGRHLNDQQCFGAAAGFALPWYPQGHLGSVSLVAAAARASDIPAMPFPELPMLGISASNRMLLLGFGALAEAEISPRVARFAGLLRSGAAEDFGLAQAAD